ncbi:MULTISPECIES: acetylornithine transaminase [Bacillus]|uniref:Acetylornithine aminotransferase n=2 Tax=Bacillus TaxID=1386 RepID=A0A0M3R928_9BACI|nr:MULTISPECIES: acetylornithine transaminase [Bacillus]ALC80712.1 acetylornithine aminotransferase [Bacillus gobiensis]MBP1079607.1 acetylornithine aminotransferase [Bacillus capparidis]MED1095008.1 acetylornithine transaminase [Bacillus capparidis]
MSHLFQTYSRWDITVKEAKGSYLVDENGKEYLDFVQGIAVSNLGHCNQAVTEAVKAQLDKVWHVSNMFHYPLQEQVAKKLTEHSDGDLVFFCNSGAEANEAAIKLARKKTQKKNIITFTQSFHGRTYATMAATAQEKIKIGFGPMLEGFHYLPYNDAESLQSFEGDDIAAVMLEVIQGEGGVNPAEESFLEAVKTFCEEKDALLIIDEIQTGIGRTGKPFAYQHYNLSPDIMTLAKGLGNGFPIGAIVGKKELGDAFSPGSHGTTFGGNMLAMAAADAVTTKIFNEEFLKDVQQKSEYLIEKLKTELDVPTVKSIRGKGFIIGIECTEEIQPVLLKLQEQGFLVIPAGPNVIRLLPPLTVTKAEVDTAVTKIKEAIYAVSTVNSKG